MKLKIHLSSPDRLQGAIAAVAGLPLDGSHDIEIKPHSEKRSAEQHGLYRVWVKVIADEMGDDVDSVHSLLKEKFLVPILIAEDAEYAEMCSRVKAVRLNGDADLALQLKRLIIANTSTTRLTVKQMSDFMDQVERFAAGMHLILPQPEDK